MAEQPLAEGVVPNWIVKVIVTAVLTALVAGTSAWGVNLGKSRSDHEKRIVKIEEHQVVRDKEIDKDLQEIKEGQKDMNKKLDRLIERRR